MNSPNTSPLLFRTLKTEEKIIGASIVCEGAAVTTMGQIVQFHEQDEDDTDGCVIETNFMIERKNADDRWRMSESGCRKIRIPAETGVQLLTEDGSTWYYEFRVEILGNCRIHLEGEQAKMPDTHTIIGHEDYHAEQKRLAEKAKEEMAKKKVEV